MPEKRQILVAIDDQRNGSPVRVRIVFGKGCNIIRTIGNRVQRALQIFTIMAERRKENISIGDDKKAVLYRALADKRWGEAETEEMRTVIFDITLEVDLRRFEQYVLPGLTEIAIC